MEGIDDDFGDLYADVEVQASSAINGVSDLPNEDKDIVKEINGSDLNKLDSIIDDTDFNNVDSSNDDDEVENEENGSDSEDDFNIVLNDDDDGLQFPVSGSVSLRSCRFQDEDREEELGMEEKERENGGVSDKNRMIVDHLQGIDGLEQSANGWDRRNGGKSCYLSQYKYIRPHTSAFASTSKVNKCEGPGSYSSPSVEGEQEDNWSCQHMRSSLLGGKNVQQFSLPRSRTILDVNVDTFNTKPWRQPEANITDFFNFGFDEDSWKKYCNHLDRCRHGDISPTRILSSDSCKHNGRRSLASKTPTEEQKRSEKQMGSAIQVAGSMRERPSSMDIRRLLDRDSDVVIQINVQDLKEDSSGSVKEEVGHIDSSKQRAYENGDICMEDGIDGLSFGSSSEDEICRESLDGHGDVLDTPASKSIRCSGQKKPWEEVGPCESGGAAKTIETSTSTKTEVGRSTDNTAPSITGAESGLEEWNQFSPSSYYAGSDCEAAIKDNNTYTDAKKTYNYVKRASPNSLTKLQKSEPSDYYQLKDFRSQRVEMNHGDYKYSAKHSRSSIRKYSKHHKQGPTGMSKSRPHPHDEEAAPISENERLYDVHHSSRYHSREGDQPLHGYDSYRGDDFSYYKEAEVSFNYYDDRFPDHWVEDAYTNYERRKGYPRYDAARDQYFLDGEKMERDWYQNERELSTNSMHPLTCQESRGLNLKYLDNERDARCKREVGELQLRKRIRNNNDFSLEQKYSYGPPREKYIRDGAYVGRGRNGFIHKYEGHLPYRRRETRSPMGQVDDFWRSRSRDHQSFFSRSYREPHADISSRWHGTESPRNDVYERIKRQGTYKRQIWSERSQEFDVGRSYTEPLDIEETVDDPHHWRRSEILQWTEEESISRLRNNKFDVGTTSFSCERTSWHKRFDSQHGTVNVRNLIDDKQVDQLTCKLITEGNRGNRYHRSSNMSRSRNHEPKPLRSGDSADLHLVDGEVKSPGFTAAGSLMYSNGRSHDNNVVQNIFVEYNKTHSEEMVRQDPIRDVESIRQKYKKRLERFPDAPKKNEAALDMEEGQILAEDVAQISGVKKGLHNNEKSATNKNMTDSNPRILEVLAKMQKRRERFKEPISQKDKIPEPLVDSVNEIIGGAKQQRPARKRRWGGN